MIGRRIAHYEVVARLGEGGMGEVFRATDIRLGRDVAIKVLPPSFVNDPDRLARFAREARLLASLNHPHIATIHGIENADGVHALVMELVDGLTLADMLAMPLAEALRIAMQIADALDTAHERGIVHRDLKPANIKVRPDGTVKVLDFGLAKSIDAPDTGINLTESPTVTSPAFTEAGVILGTAAYMSPEQARGQPVDKRTDIWAFGCVLFEMITGRMTFPGATVSDMIAAILERQPDWKLLPAETPPNVRYVLERCLEKDPKRRWRDIGDVRVELDQAERWRPAGEAVPRRSSRVGERLAWAALVLIAAAGATFATVALRKPPPAAAEIRFDMLFPRGMSADFAQLAISPDGQQIVIAPTFGAQQPEPLWLRPVNSTTGRTLPGSEGASFPFWSPDGESIGFFAEGKLKRLDVRSEAIQILADAPVARGGVWQPDGMILFAPNATGPLSRVAATGGQPAVATTLQPGQNDHRAPFLLPDGEHFLYFARGTPQVRGVYVARLDGTNSRRLLDADGAAVYTASGHLLFARQGELLAQNLDQTQLTLNGEAFHVADRVSVNPAISLASLSASPSGAIAYGTGSIRRTQFAWFDRSGKSLETLGAADQTGLANPSLSADGQQLAYSRSSGRNWDVWLMDMHGALNRLTSTIALDFNPVWSPDGHQIFFQSNNSNIHSRAVNDSTAEQVVLKLPTMGYPADISGDGRTLLFTRGGGLSTDLWYVPLAGDRTPHEFVVSPTFSERDGQFSPDGKWVAYQSNESGHWEIYLQPFPGPGERIQVSSGGGQQVRWAAQSGELFYVAGNQQLTAVKVTIAGNGTITIGSRIPLFRTEVDNAFQARQQYVVSADGQRFLVNASTDAVDPPAITVILNWKGTP